MRALILADRSFALRERSMLARLEVGLADEGVRVIHAAPRSAGPLESGTLYSAVVTYADPPRFETHWSLRRRARDLARSVEDAAGGSAALDVVHVFGGGAWRLGLEVARLARAAPVLELWRPGLLGQAAAVAAAPGPGRPPTFLVSEAPLATALRSRAPAARVAEVPWGVHTPPELPPRGRADGPLAVALLSDTADHRLLGPALAGLVDAARTTAQPAPAGTAGPAPRELLVFAAVEDASRAREASLWSAARRMGVLDRLSMTPQLESRREPVLDMDILLIPEAGGRQRTLTLEAMAGGMAVIALADPFMSSLIDGVTARVVRAPTTVAWSEAVGSLLRDPAGADALVASARRWVHDHRLASDHIAGVLRVYDGAARSAGPAAAPTAADAG